MNYLTATVVKRCCLFVLEVVYPMDTLARLVKFFEERHILIEQLHFY